MTNLTVAQALAQLKDNSTQYTMSAALRILANQVSTESTGKVTVLYSGKIGGVESNAIIEAMILQGEDIRVINKTPAADFLSSPEYRNALAEAFDVDPILLADRTQPANQFLFDPKDGVWAEASSRFAAGATGDVRKNGVRSSIIRSRFIGAGAAF